MEKLLRSRLCAVLAVLFCPGIPAGQFEPRPCSPRICRLDGSRSQRLLIGGRVNFEIVMPPGGGRAVRFAADELAGLLGRVAGRTLPVLTERTGSLPALIVGDRELARRQGLDLDGLDRDGFHIRSLGRDILMVGRDDPRSMSVFTEKGTLYAVYDFLERFAGVRFYFPGDIGTIAPRRSDWSVPHVEITDRPDFQHRQIYAVKLGSLSRISPDPHPEQRVCWYDESLATDREIMPQYRLAVNFRARASTRNLPNCHGLAHLGLVERFGKTHPEYFALDDRGMRKNGVDWVHPNDRAGQICFSSRGLFEEVYQDAKAILTRQPPESRNALLPDGRSAWNPKGHSPGEFFGVMPNDSCYLCRCPECRRHFAGSRPGHYDQATTDHIWRFMAGIARRLQAEGIPGHVTTLAYSQYRGVPSFDLPDNMIVQLAVTGPWNGTGARQRNDDRLLREWTRKLGARIYLWTYPSKYWMRIPSIPNMAPRAVGNYFKERAGRLFGAYLEAESDRWIFGYLNYHVFAKVLWNKDTDIDRLLAEHHRLMFGKAAPEMARFFDLLERHWIDDLCGQEVETPTGPARTLPTQKRIWTEIYSPAECGRISRILDTALARTEGDPDSRRRVRFMRKQLWEPVLQAMDRYRRMVHDCQDWRIHLAGVPAGERIVIDGEKRERAWAAARPFWLVPKDDLRQERIAEATRGQALFDQDGLYLFLECDEPLTDRMLTARRRKDDPGLWQDNCFEIYLAAPGRTNEGYQFIVNSDGQVASMRFSPGLCDWKWDAGLEVRTRTVPGSRWQAEVRIPRRALGLEGRQTIRANLTRYRMIRDEPHSFYTWCPYVRADNHATDDYGCWSLAPSADANLLDNGDFTEGIRARRFAGGWFADRRIVLDRKVFRTGGASARLDPGDPRLTQYLAGLKPGGRYRLTYYIKTEDLRMTSDHRSAFEVRLNFANGHPIILPSEAGYLGTAPWTRQSFDFQAPEDMNTRQGDRVYLRFQMFPQWLAGTAWIDKVRIEELR